MVGIITIKGTNSKALENEEKTTQLANHHCYIRYYKKYIVNYMFSNYQNTLSLFLVYW